MESILIILELVFYSSIRSNIYELSFFGISYISRQNSIRAPTITNVLVAAFHIHMTWAGDSSYLQENHGPVSLAMVSSCLAKMRKKTTGPRRDR